MYSTVYLLDCLERETMTRRNPMKNVILVNRIGNVPNVIFIKLYSSLIYRKSNLSLTKLPIKLTI